MAPVFPWQDLNCRFPHIWKIDFRFGWPGTPWSRWTLTRAHVVAQQQQYLRCISKCPSCKPCQESSGHILLRESWGGLPWCDLWSHLHFAAMGCSKYRYCRRTNTNRYWDGNILTWMFFRTKFLNTMAASFLTLFVFWSGSWFSSFMMYINHWTNSIFRKLNYKQNTYWEFFTQFFHLVLCRTSLLVVGRALRLKEKSL